MQSFNFILAGIVYQHPSIESLRRELLRKGQLREICGFDLCRGERAVPPAYVYTRFCRKLMIYTDEVEKIFLRLVDETKTLLPDFGRVLDLRTAKPLIAWPGAQSGINKKSPKSSMDVETATLTLARKRTGVGRH